MKRLSPRRLVLWFLAPALLVAVAGGHSYQVATKNLTPWEGGGFGMFSTVDKRQARFVRCYLVTPTDEVLVRMPRHLHTYVERLRALPTRERVEQLAGALARSTWVEAEDRPELPASSDSSTPAGTYRYLPPSETSEQPEAPVEAVRVEVWRYEFVSRPYQLDAHRLFAVTRQASAADLRAD